MLTSRIRVRQLRTHELPDFDAVALNHTRIQAQTDRAVCYSHPRLGEIWLPKSQMRRDGAGNLYLTSWLKEKYDL